MGHRIRVAASAQVEIIEQALQVFQEMKEHLESCTVCSDEAFCTVGGDAYHRLSDEKRRLKVIGLSE